MKTIQDFINEKICVRLPLGERRARFLTALGDAGVRWCGGDLPQNNTFDNYDLLEIATGCYSDNKPYSLSFSSEMSLANKHGYTLVPFEEFVIPQPQSIHITVKGNTTHAILKDGDKVVRRASAKCAPGDEFDFFTGVEIALFRLKHQIAR